MQYDYGSLIGMGFRFYDAERVGALPANFTIPWRGPSLLQVRPVPVTPPCLRSFCLQAPAMPCNAGVCSTEAS